jgi:glycosyltransferase involved in cell wall biosynthesis
LCRNAGEIAAMRILHVLPELNRSGAEIMLLTGAEEMRKTGHSHSILLVKKDGGALAGPIRDAGFPVEFHWLWKTPLAAWRFGQILKRLDPDIVHVEVEYNHAMFSAIARLQGRGVTRTIHNVFRFSGLHRARKIAQRWLLSRAGVHYVACSRSVRQNEISHLKLSPRVIDNWFDVAHFLPPSEAQRADARTALGIAQGAFVMATVGNCAAQKNHTALIDALAVLNKETEVTLLHAGREDEGHSERALAQNLGVAEKAIFAGIVEDVRGILHAADVFVLPSFIEGSSIALLEAAAAGLPCLLTNVGLTPEIADQDGVTVIKPTTDSIVSAVRAWKAQPLPHLRQKGLQLSDYVRARFSPARGAAEYAELYAQLKKT